MSIDDRLSIRNIAHLLADYDIPDEQVEIDGARHAVYITDPNQFNRFFRNVSGRTRIERRASDDPEHDGDELYADYKGWEFYTRVRRNITRVRHR
jgi:hypothetical protein